MKDISKDYKVKVNSDEGAFNLAGAIIKVLATPVKYRNKQRYEDINEYLRKQLAFTVTERSKRLRFLKTQPLVRHWCDVSGYSYSKVKKKILEVNKVL